MYVKNLIYIQVTHYSTVIIMEQCNAKHVIMIACHTNKQESPANAKGTRDSSACMKAHCEQM